MEIDEAPTQSASTVATPQMEHENQEKPKLIKNDDFANHFSDLDLSDYDEASAGSSFNEMEENSFDIEKYRESKIIDSTQHQLEAFMD